MKDIRIFVASSKELEKERNYLAFLVLAHEDEFAARGLRVRLAKWEYVDPTMTEARTEDRYLDEMLDCDAVLMMFRHVLGMYTKEEVDKAIAAEVAGTSRIKKHLMLFKDGDVEPSAELAAWRATLPEGTYGTFTGFVELKAHFLRLVEELSGLPLQDTAQEESVRLVSAFLAVDDELAADRNAFADAVLNLNDVLVRRGARVRLRFYDPEKHRELLESSEMALVLYHTKCGDFGEAALDESYGRSKRDENPKRLYVFFRDADGQPMADGFDAFKDGFADKFGSAPCRFENVDTLSLNFLFSLESILGDDGGTFVKLDGRTVVADGLEVGDLAKLPMLERNEGLAALFSRMQDVSKRFVDQRGKCEKDPQNDGLYVELLDISAEKNRLQDQIDRELKMSFNLAKRMAAVSIAQTNDTIARARAKMDEGKIKEALEILDGASAAMKRRRLLHRAAERAEAENLQIKELAEYNQIELFRISAIMAFTSMLYRDRIARVNEIAYESVHDLLEGASLFTGKNSLIIHSFADQILSLVSTLPLDGIHTGHLVGFFRGVSAMFGLSTLALENGAGVEQADRLLSSSMDWDFTRYYASRAVDDMETRDGWDRFDATEEACRYIGVCRHVGVKVPDDAMIVVTRMKLLVGYEDHDPHGGMIDYERLLSESKVCRDVCELQSCVGNHYITSEDLVKLACEFNTMCLAFHLAEGGERDGDFAQRAVKNGADYEVANKLCMAMNGK